METKELSLNEAYAKFYNLSDHLAVDEVIVKWKGRAIFRQHIPNRKIYKLCNESQYTYDMTVYFIRDSHSATDMTATHATIRHLTSRVEVLGHKIFMDNFFSSPRLFDDLDRRKINSCRTVRPNRKDMTRDFGSKQLKMNRGDASLMIRGGFTALVWYDRHEVYMLTNMVPPPAEGNFCDKSNSTVKPQIVERYNWHMVYVDNSDHIVKLLDEST